MIILDTHVLVWSHLQPRKLSRAAASTIRRAAMTGELSISAITLVELAGLLNRGRLRVRGSLESSIQGLIGETKIKPITVDIAVLTAQFPPDFPSDPMDRIIAATARAEGLPLATVDERILSCPLLKTIW
jgi:PIN domain nuclease of toxin-antitoxin system